MGKKRKLILSVAAVSLILTVTACDGSAGSGQPTSAVNGTLKIGVANVPTTLDPGQNTGRDTYGITGLYAGTLTEMSRDGKDVMMGLAESAEASDTRYVVKLKPDLKFSDGSALTAKDVAASFEHYMADDTNSYGYAFAAIEQVNAVDDLTVEFNLKQPAPALPYYLAQPQSAIIPAKSIEAKGVKDLYKGDPLPTAGQFMVDSYDQNGLTLKANLNFSGPQPSTTTVVFQKISDVAARLAQVQSGQIDFADEIGPKQTGQLSAPVEARTAVAVNGLNLMDMNNRDNSLLADVRIRQAVAAAVDREQVNKVAFTGFSAPVLGYFTSSSRFSRPFLSKTADVAHAKELLAGTACASGCKLVILLGPAEASGDAAIVIQQNLKAVGIDASIEKADDATEDKRMKEGNYDLHVSYTYDVGDYPDGLLAWLLGTANMGHKTGYLSAEMDQRIDSATTTSGTARDAAIGEINDLFQKDLPWAPLNEYTVVSASRVPADLFGIDPTMFYHVG